MAKKEKIYKKLPGKRRSIAGTHTLWAGPDHLFSVTTTMGSESYKRFYYQDIQAVVSRKTVRGKVLNAIFGIGAPPLFLLEYQIGLRDGGWFFMGLAVFWLILLMVNLFRGPTCETFLHTAVQKESLPCLNRLKYVRKFIRILQPTIEETQGKLSREEARAHLERRKREPVRKTRAPAPGGTTAATRDAAPEVRHEPGNMHKLLFVTLFAGALAMAAPFAYKHVVATLTPLVIFCGAIILAIMALVKQKKSDLPLSLCNSTWVALAFLCFALMKDYIFAMTAIMTNPDLINNQWALYSRYARMSLTDNPYILGVHLFFMAGGLILGLYGLLLAFKWRGAGTGRGDERVQDPGGRNPR
ncbi:MAG: hypothetical protein GY859_27165 [Desulfobacterales bacterium]|nr:hypothetical protein [Desulfobacterales bacterium]